MTMPLEHRCTVCCFKCPAQMSRCWMKMSLEQVWNRGLIVIQDADQYGISYYEKHQFKLKHLSHTFYFEM